MSKNVMVIDCEFTQPNKRCIQIGAAIYNPRTAELIDTLETYVDPKEEISQYITDLTGIRNQDVQGAPNIVEAYGMLKAFHKKHNVFLNPLVWGSGVSNDSLALYKEYLATLGFTYEESLDADVEENFMGYRVIDAKALYVSYQLAIGGQYAGGLARSMKRLGLNFEGTVHTALADAKNTFTIWYHLTKKMRKD